MESRRGAAYARMDEMTGRIAFSWKGLRLFFGEWAAGGASAEIEAKEDGFRLTLRGEGAFEGGFECPGTLISEPGDVHLLPIGEGFAFPVDDPRVEVLPAKRDFLSTSQCMGCWALLRAGYFAVFALDTPEDASIESARGGDGLLVEKIYWEAELGRWGYPRTLRVLAGEGGATEAMKAYRRYRERLRPVRTLREKRETLPALDRLIGAPDVWLFCDEYEKAMYTASTEPIDVRNEAEVLRVAKEMRVSGVDHALLGAFFECDGAWARQVGALGYLTSKYDNYQDVLPAPDLPLIPEARVRECDYTRRRAVNWPNEVRVRKDGSLAPAWALRGTDGRMHPQNTMCARCAPPFVAPEIGPIARRDGYAGFFLDVLGCGLGECYSERHPMTRSQCRDAGLAMLRAVGELGLIAGTEEGVECFASEYAYAEGRMSPQQYRINYLESGRHKAVPYKKEEHEAAFDTFMLNPKYRVPLWELAYHDCVVSYGYWGDAANCCMERLPARDAFSALYALPPIYSLKTSAWDGAKDRLLASMRRACPAARRAGWDEMTDFRWLSPDGNVQRTRFAGGLCVTVNFSEQTAEADGELLPPWGISLRDGETHSLL